MLARGPIGRIKKAVRNEPPLFLNITCSRLISLFSNLVPYVSDISSYSVRKEIHQKVTKRAAVSEQSITADLSTSA